MDETDPALDPAHRPRELDRVAAQLIGRGGQTRGLLGVGHHRFDLVKLTRKPCGQTVRQQAEGGVALTTVPASDLCPARGLARVGAVARQRTSPVGVIRTAIEPCITPRPGTNVLLAGKPRFVAKLHRPWPGGVPPARANSSLIPRGVETTTAALVAPSGEDVDASFGPGGVLWSVWIRPGEAGASPPLAHTRRSRAHILTASATTIHDKGNGTGSDRFSDCFVIPGNSSTEQTGELPWGFHETKRETTPGHQQPRPTPARALCESEREHVLDVLACPRFVDRAPAEVVATLLDEGQYLCSARTMYRILAANQPVRERRNQRDHPQYTKPELVATGPNQTWSWDITKLLGPKKWTYFYLYVVLDIFSRYALGWMVADRENSALAGRLIEQTCHKQGVQPQVLTLHSDRGAPMTSKCTAQLLADLGVTRSLSRPQVSDDNPFSEAQFKTLKYHPDFPGRFHDLTAAIAFCRSFFPWYNTEHRHAGIAMLTPDDVHHHRAHSVLQQRERTLQAAWTHHPERFVRGVPQPDPLPQAVWINPPATTTTGETAQ